MNIFPAGSGDIERWGIVHQLSDNVLFERMSTYLVDEEVIYIITRVIQLIQRAS